MMKWKAFCIFFLLSLCLLSSCATKTTTEYVYVPVDLNVQELAQPVLDMRPADVVLIDDIQTLSDVMQNSVAFQQSYNEWRSYAIALEGFITNLDLSGKNEYLSVVF